MPVNEGITQKAIIDILLKTESIEEPTLRAKIKQKLSLKDDSNIRVHINKLNTSGCITKKDPLPGKANIWEISYNNLKQIVDRFPDIDFKQNTNVIELVYNHIKKSQPPALKAEDMSFLYSGITEDDCLTLKYALINSDSFFKACITTDYETLTNRWNELLHVKELTDNVYKKAKDIRNNSFDISPLGTAINHYIEQDIMNGKATKKEINYMIFRCGVTMPDDIESIYNDVFKTKLRLTDP